MTIKKHRVKRINSDRGWYEYRGFELNRHDIIKMPSRWVVRGIQTRGYVADTLRDCKNYIDRHLDNLAAAFQEGDIIWNPNYPGEGNHVILYISLAGTRSDLGYFVTAPLTRRGWPSINQQKWHTIVLGDLGRMKQSRKYPHMLTCPNCSQQAHNKQQALLWSGLRMKNIYEDAFECKQCKEVFRSPVSQISPEKTSFGY